MTFTDESEHSTSRASNGKLAVLAMIAVAVAAATFAWWWNFNRGRLALDFYGAEAATLIRTAPQAAIVSANGNIDISKAPGLLNARASLLSDASYRWQETPESTQPAGSAVQFTRGDRTVTIEFDFGAASVQASSTGKSATLQEKTATGWQQFIERNTVNAKAGSPTPPEPARTDPSE